LAFAQHRASLRLCYSPSQGAAFSRLTSGVYFYLADRAAAALGAEFRAAGIPILSPLAPREWHMNEFILSDPDGNLLRFGEDILIP
jgi:hypothetical protein